MVKNELLKKLDTRAVKHERRVQSGCEAERYPRLGTGGSPGGAIPAFRDRRLAGAFRDRRLAG